MRRVKLVIASTLLLFLFGCSEKPVITGTVRDNFGKPLPDVVVKIENSAFSSVTDSSGRYSVAFAPGTCMVVIGKAGYSERRVSLNLASNTDYPMNDTTLTQIPNGSGFFLQGTDRYIPLVPTVIDMSQQTSGPMSNTGVYSARTTEASFSQTKVLEDEVARLGGAALVFVDTTPEQYGLLKVEGNRVGEAVSAFIGSRSSFQTVKEQDERLPGMVLRRTQLKGSDITQSKRFCFVEMGQTLMRQSVPRTGAAHPAYCIGGATNWGD